MHLRLVQRTRPYSRRRPVGITSRTGIPTDLVFKVHQQAVPIPEELERILEQCALRVAVGCGGNETRTQFRVECYINRQNGDNARELINKIVSHKRQTFGDTQAISKQADGDELKS